MLQTTLRFEGAGIASVPAYLISADAVMPAISATVTINGVGQHDRLLRVWVTVNVLYNQNGCNDDWNNVIELPLLITQQCAIATPDIRGGTMTLISNVSIKKFPAGNIENIQSVPAIFTIAAAAPAKDVVRKMLGNDYLNTIIFRRSRFEQFDANGQPVFSNGAGLSRIVSPTIAELWNWKANAAQAVAEWEQHKKITAQIPANLRAKDPGLYKSLPDFTAAELEIETLQSFGQGNYLVPKRQAISSRWKWLASGTSDGYADAGLAILERVNAGKPPVGWV